MLKRKGVYFLITILCFALCVLIVKTMSNFQTIRGFIGDVIVTVLIYCSVKTFIRIRPIKLSLIVLVFSYAVECLQYLNFIDIIGLGENKIARIVIGTTFDWRDLAAYTMGVIFVYLLDTKLIDSSSYQNPSRFS